MFSVWCLTIIVQSCVLLCVYYAALRVLRDRSGDFGEYSFPPHARVGREFMPYVAMIIPAAGNHPNMENALRSLLMQDYDKVLPVLVTATRDEPAACLGETLRKEFPQLVCLAAGDALHCGQKNHNLLYAIRHVQNMHTIDTPNTPEVFVFCDSTHTAQPDFLDELVQPIARGEVGICTGYHEVEAHDARIVTLAYQISVMFMRFLQAISVFTQPWGGAMAISRTLFEKHDISRVWETHVVDDCSLAALALARQIPVRLCPKAMLVTTARGYTLSMWRTWMERQILFLKFCVRSQWYLLGFFALLLLFPIIGSVYVILSMSDYFLIGIVHLCVLSGLMLIWRGTALRCDTLSGGYSVAPVWAWCSAFFLAITMFFYVFFKSFRQWHMDWHGIRYEVCAGGRVVRLLKK